MNKVSIILISLVFVLSKLFLFRKENACLSLLLRLSHFFKNLVHYRQTAAGYSDLLLQGNLAYCNLGRDYYLPIAVFNPVIQISSFFLLLLLLF